jgi:hypothetical protein
MERPVVLAITAGMGAMSGINQFFVLVVMASIAVYLFVIAAQVALLAFERFALNREPAQSIFRGLCQCIGFACAILGFGLRDSQLYIFALLLLSLAHVLSWGKPDAMPARVEKPLLLLTAASLLSLQLLAVQSM